eukprot:scaffold14471_cov113-Isochrysis_galbana.AAC.7
MARNRSLVSARSRSAATSASIACASGRRARSASELRARASSREVASASVDAGPSSEGTQSMYSSNRRQSIAAWRAAWAAATRDANTKTSSARKSKSTLCTLRSAGSAFGAASDTQCSDGSSQA